MRPRTNSVPAIGCILVDLANNTYLLRDMPPSDHFVSILRALEQRPDLTEWSFFHSLDGEESRESLTYAELCTRSRVLAVILPESVWDSGHGDRVCCSIPPATRFLSLSLVFARPRARSPSPRSPPRRNAGVAKSAPIVARRDGPLGVVDPRRSSKQLSDPDSRGPRRRSVAQAPIRQKRTPRRVVLALPAGLRNALLFRRAAQLHVRSTGSPKGRCRDVTPRKPDREPAN